MTVLKTIEIMADSNQSWEDATRQALKQAAKSVDNIKSVWVKDQSCHVNNGEISSFRVITKITFEVKN
ncbi:MAG: dodecin family protein [Fimbriimonadaceae bacterium]|nr:dodecin family protein [Alphaproteobacteria bacterium]